jgi:hypothetical protein
VNDDLIQWIITSNASADTVRSLLTDRGVDLDEVRATASERLRAMSDAIDTDPSVTADGIRAVRTILDASTTASVDTASDPVDAADDDDGSDTEDNDAVANDGDEPEDDGGGAVTLDKGNDGSDTAPVVEGELIGAEAFKARSGGGNTKMNMVNPGVAARFSTAAASNDSYQAFAGRGGGELKTAADVTKHVDKQMELLRKAGSSDNVGIELVQYKSVEGGLKFHRDANMTRRQVAELIDAATAYHTEKFANGFCAPSVQMYEFCPVPQAWGLFGNAVPMIASERGGIEWPSTPSIGTLWGQGIECRTEAEEIARDEAGTPKACTHLDCPDWTDYRNRICHICVTSGILQRKAFPESIDQAIRTYELIYEMWVNWQMLQLAIEAADAQNGELRWDTSGWGILQALKEKIGFAIDSIAARTLLNPWDTVWNVALPFWAYSAIQADMAKRVGASIEMMSVTREPIEVILRGGRTVRFWPQMPWQTALVEDIPDPSMRTWIGSDTSLQNGVYPETMELLIWPQGAFLGVRDDFLDIRARWDYDLQRQNRQLEWFSETEWNLIPRCYEAVHITLDICTAGRSGSLFEYPCNTPPAPGFVDPVSGLTTEEAEALRSLARRELKAA